MGMMTNNYPFHDHIDKVFLEDNSLIYKNYNVTPKID